MKLFCDMENTMFFIIKLLVNSTYKDFPLNWWGLLLTNYIVKLKKHPFIKKQKMKLASNQLKFQYAMSQKYVRRETHFPWFSSVHAKNTNIIRFEMLFNVILVGFFLFVKRILTIHEYSVWDGNGCLGSPITPLLPDLLSRSLTKADMQRQIN